MWEKVDIVFKLKSPLHIGYLPFNSFVVSPTRYYIPGKNLWGAVTKRITEYFYEKPKKEDYKRVGRDVMRNFRFSYFYIYDGKISYFPHYTESGLKYGDNKKKIMRSEFEQRFIGSRISTAMNNAGTQKEGSLHEIEFINNKFNDEKERVKNVKIRGYVWLKKNAKINDRNIIIKNDGIFVNKFNIIKALILGGESKYGFGHVILDSIDKIKFPIEYDANESTIKVKVHEDKPLILHLKYNKNIRFRGNIEILAGRMYFNLTKPGYYLSPGTILKNDVFVEIKEDGTGCLYAHSQT